MRQVLKVAGLVIVLFVLVLFACAWLPARNQCHKLCKAKGYRGPEAVIGWVYPKKCVCRGDEFPLWERKKP